MMTVPSAVAIANTVSIAAAVIALLAILAAVAQEALVIGATALPTDTAGAAPEITIAVAAVFVAKEMAASATQKAHDQGQTQHYAFHQRHPLRTPLAPKSQPGCFVSCFRTVAVCGMPPSDNFRIGISC